MSEEIDIKALREARGWTQGDLAEYLGLDRSSVSRLERGQKPKGPTAKLIAALIAAGPEETIPEAAQ
jgi:transcriptional regulator with XRE-family HTH domain